jgi:hypothetical protein
MYFTEHMVIAVARRESSVSICDRKINLYRDLKE